jgi:4-hydroxy-2-oxoheptanedioate aldolase
MNNIKLALKKSKLKGFWSLIPSITVSEILSLSGSDFLILDMEHGNFSKKDINACISACKINNCYSIVRVPLEDKTNIQSALDSGCSGIIFPKISNKSEAEESVSLCEFPPKGKRGFNPFTRFNQYNQSSKRIDPLVKIIIIETIEGINNLDEILSVKEIDGVYLGVYDLSKDYNVKSVENKNLIKIIANSLKKINFYKKFSGLMINNKSSLKLAKKYKSNFLVFSVDSEILGSAAKKKLNSY